jgi:hypothetical protein
MSSAFCSIEDAFSGPVTKSKNKKSSRSGAGRENAVPGPLSGSPTSDSVPEPMGPPSSAMGKPDANGMALQEFFPLPGDSAEPDEWAKAFTLEGSQMPQIMRPDGPMPYGGSRSGPAAAKPILWQSPQSTVMAKVTGALSNASPGGTYGSALGSAGVPGYIGASGSGDINQRLDTLTKQLEALTTVTPMQSTAELFLFIAIGLIFLLAMDTLLRCATNIALSKAGVVPQSGGGRGSGGRFISRRWLR